MSIDVAIIGAGQVVNDLHLPVWGKVRSARVRAICDISAEAARATADRWNVPSYYNNIEELFSREQVQVVDICTPPATHLPLTVQAMEAGYNVIFEKPMTMTLEESRKLMSAYAGRTNKDLKVGVIYSWLFWPKMRKLLKRVSSGEIGDIIHAEFCSYATQNDPMIADPHHWCHSLPAGRYGEGIIHPIYLLAYLIGPMEIDTVRIDKKGNSPWITYDDLFVTFKTKNGVVSIYDTYNSEMDGSFFTLTLTGTKGQLKFDEYNMSVTSRSLRPAGAWNKGKGAIGEIVQLGDSLVGNVMDQIVPGRLKTAHEIYFNLFIESVLQNSGPPLALEKANEGHEIFLKLLDTLESMQPWRPKQ